MSVWQAYGRDKGSWKLAKDEAVVDGSFERLREFGLHVEHPRSLGDFYTHTCGRHVTMFRDLQEFLDDYERRFLN